MNCELKESGDRTMLALSGECTIECAKDLAKALLEALSSRDRLVVNFEGVEAVDLSCLQILCSAHRSAVKAGKTLMFHPARPDALFRAALDAGYVRTTACRKNPGGKCLMASDEKKVMSDE